MNAADGVYLCIDYCQLFFTPRAIDRKDQNIAITRVQNVPILRMASVSEIPMVADVRK